MHEQVKSVDLLTWEIKNLLESNLRSIWVEGEVSGYKLNTASGHAYFNLKGDKSLISSVMFRSDLQKQKYIPQEGDRLQIFGEIRVYEPQGKYQLYARLFRAAGHGDLFQQFQKLKQKMQDEGLFDVGRKRPLPPLPRNIGIVTSSSGAALRDIVKVAWHRFPGISLIISPATVQGIEAPLSIIQALKAFDVGTETVDVIILGRGGGSMEDLWAFNDERLVRAVAASKIPIVSAVGHETDFTLCDFAADLRAATPSAAAQLVVPEKSKLMQTIDDYMQSIQRENYKIFREQRLKLVHLQHRLAQGTPLKIWNTGSQRLDFISDLLEKSMTNVTNGNNRRFDIARQRLQRFNFQQQLDSKKSRLQNLVFRKENAVKKISKELMHRIEQRQRALEALNPQSILKRGYSICFKESSLDKGLLVTSAKQLKVNDRVRVVVSEGEFFSEVKEVRVNGK